MGEFSSLEQTGATHLGNLRALDLMSNHLKFQSQERPFGKKLGRTVQTDMNEVGQGFDAVCSCHVLEHTPTPAFAREACRAGRCAHAERKQGLLSDGFAQSIAGCLPYIVTSDDRPEKLADWDGVSQVKQPTDGAGAT
jgi:hypothetical protein